MTGRGVTAEQAARAIVVAAMLLGVDPARAFDKGHRGGKGVGRGAPAGRMVRVLAAHGVRSRLGVAPVALARIFDLFAQELAPSFARRKGLTTDQLLAISEALGPVEDDDARARFSEPMSGAPIRPAPQPKPEARSPKPEARSPKPEARSPKPEARSREVRGVSEEGKALKAERPRAVQYASWFLEAGWRLKTVASLFDVSPGALLDALDPEGAS